MVNAYAPRSGRLALFLEGGYNAGALRTSVAATLGALLDLPRDVEAPTSGGPGREAVGTAKRARDLAIDTLASASPAGGQW
jgi:acetoin utilization deacetylase AcuC-like enzyme